MTRFRGLLGDLSARLAGAGARAISRRSLVRRAGVLPVAGLLAQCVIRFDEHGVPHIQADNDLDLFRAHGVVHALDRYFQMDLLRRVLRGRLAEVVGEKPLGPMALPPFSADRTTTDTDIFLRTLGLLPAAQRVWRAAAPTNRALLQAYVQGVNAALPLVRRQRPLEYRALGLGIQPWTPVDSILLAKGMALSLSFKWRTALGYGAMADRLADRPDHFARLLPQGTGPATVAVTQMLAGVAEEVRRFAPAPIPALGSNAWVAGSARSPHGKPVLASDPHLELSLPGVWYLSSLRGHQYQAVGCSIPGIPGIVIGRTPSMAWGLTNGMVDDADLWREELDGAGRRYRLDGSWRPLRRHTEEIRRKGQAPRLFARRATHRGPLLSDALPGYVGPSFSIRMTLQEEALDLEAFLGLGRARTVDEGLAAAAGFGSPAQNLLLADTAGAAGYRLMGNVPIRTGDAHPVLPRDGTTSASDWQGFLPAEELPQCRIGDDDVLVSANNNLVDAAYPHYLSHLYEPDYRARRIHAVLAGRDVHTADDHRRLQLDAHSEGARAFRAAVLVPLAEAARRMRPALGPMIDRLLAWDGHESRDAPGAIPHHLVYHFLVRRTFQPVLGKALTEAWMGMINMIDAPLLAAFTEPDSPWAPADVRASLLVEAMEDAQAEMTRLGLTLDSPWGAWHRLTLRHPAGRGPLAGTFNQGPFPLDGGPFSVTSGQYPHARPGRVVAGASYRQVVDLGALDAGGMITFGGQSGHVGSRHYADLTPRWLAGDLLPMRLETPPDTLRRLELVVP